MSGAKKPSARDSIAMRGPSRQITAVLMAGGALPAAMARARSAMTKPSAPSAMPASVSGRPGFSRAAGDWACNFVGAVTAPPWRVRENP